MRFLFLSDWCVCIGVNICKIIPPKRRFLEKRWNAFSKHFSRAWVLDLATNHWKVNRNPHFILVFIFQNLRSGSIKMGLHKYKRTQWHDDSFPFFVGLMRLYLCKLFARWVYKIQTHAMTRRCVAFVVGTMRLYRGKTICKMGLQNTNARNDTTMRCFCCRNDAFV
jgi:hypothetical protein